MTTPSKRKGSSYEREVAEYLQSWGWPAERTRAGWSDDRGDLAGVPFVVECKNQKQLNFPAWLDETIVETQNASFEFGFLIAKRRLKRDVGQHYFVQTVESGLRLVRRAGL